MRGCEWARECKLRKNCVAVLITAGKIAGVFHNMLSRFEKKKKKKVLCLAYNSLYPGEQNMLILSSDLYYPWPPFILPIQWNHFCYYILSVTYKKKKQYYSFNQELLRAWNMRGTGIAQNKKNSRDHRHSTAQVRFLQRIQLRKTYRHRCLNTVSTWAPREKMHTSLEPELQQLQNIRKTLP